MNKMFKKFMAVTATLAIAATMSVSAFAADVTVAPTDDKVSVTPATAENATMYTVMVFSCAADADKATAVPADANAIYYINQGTDVTALVSNMLVKATSETEYLPAGNYVVRIGNDTGSVQNFTLESKVAETGVQITLSYGDVNGDGSTDGADATIVLRKAANLITAFVDAEDREIPLNVGDVNGDGSTDGADATIILRKAANLITGFTDADGNALTTYTYTYVAPTE